VAHRYWRLYIWKPEVGTVPSIAEMELRSSLGGSDETGSGTASASNESWGAAANAFDGVTTNFWAPSGIPAWIAYDFGSGNDLDIVEISITARNDAAYKQTPFKFDLEYSDNGSDWTVLYTFRSETYTQGQTRVFNSADATNLVDIVPGSYRYYRIHVDSTFTDVGGCTVAELDLRESSGGSDVTGSGTSDASSDYSVDYDFPKAFDDDTNTFWSSELISVPHWLSYDFGAGNEKAIVEIALRIRGDSYYSAQDITEFRVQVSSDNSTWYTINVEQAIPVWSTGLQRVYTIDLGISVVDTVEVAEDTSISGLAVIDVNIDINDSVGVVEDISTAIGILWTDFSKYTAEVQPYNWTERWHTDVAAAVVHTESLMGMTSAALLDIDHSSAGRYLLSWDILDESEDIEVLTLNRWASAIIASGVMGAVVRGSGSDSTEKGYIGYFQDDTNTVYLKKYVAGSATTLDSHAMTMGDDTWYWMRLRVEGTSVKLKTWEYGDPEPAAWGSEATDSDVEGGGWAGVLTLRSDWEYVDCFSAAYDGGTAPTPFAPNIYDEVEIVEDITVTVEEAVVTNLDINVVDTVSATENTSFSFLSIVSIIDTLLVEEDVSVSVVSDTLPLGLAHGNSAPYDYFSLDDSEADPITVQIELDQTGGDLDSDYVLIYLIADDSFDLVTIEIQSEDAGVEWKISETDSDYGDSINKSSVTAGAYPVYAKATVANDGTIITDQVSANFKVTAW